MIVPRERDSETLSDRENRVQAVNDIIILYTCRVDFRVVFVKNGGFMTDYTSGAVVDVFLPW